LVQWNTPSTVDQGWSKATLDQDQFSAFSNEIRLCMPVWLPRRKWCGATRA